MLSTFLLLIFGKKEEKKKEIVESSGEATCLVKYAVTQHRTVVDHPLLSTAFPLTI